MVAMVGVEEEDPPRPRLARAGILCTTQLSMAAMVDLDITMVKLFTCRLFVHNFVGRKVKLACEVP